MRFPPFLDLYAHEAMPKYGTWRFWIDFRMLRTPSYWIVGLVPAFYLLTTLKVMAVVVAMFGPPDAVRSIIVSYDVDAYDLWASLAEFLQLLLCVFVGENVARVALEVSSGRPFTEFNIARFRRAAIATLSLGVWMIVARLIERSTDLSAVNTNSGSVFFVLLCAVVFFSLAGAFRQGKKLKEEQDLTV